MSATIAFLVFLLVGIFLQEGWVRYLRKIRLEQIFKEYGPEGHLKTKVGTPTMGGVVFVVVGLAICATQYLRGESPFDLFRLWALAFGGAAVGVLDDLHKFFKQSGDGLTSRQKLALQIVATLPWAIVAAMTFDGVFARTIGTLSLLFLGVGILNAVNVTDGLDGLAAGSSAISFGAALFLLPYGAVAGTGAVAGCALAVGFLWHNAFPAKVFMGDAGAHFLGGLLIGVCAASGSIAALFPLGAIFGVEIISVALQIVSIRWFGRKIFAMSPLHHHFEIAGWKETQIVARFWIAHLAGLAGLGWLLGTW